MLQLFTSIALVSLIAPWRATCDETTYFGCNKNVDAICSGKMPSNIQKQLWWAERLGKHTRNYKCINWTEPLCCPQGAWNPNEHGDGFICVNPQDIKDKGCHFGGQ
ncbi:hypothetical protein Pst134EA_019659 [Puccinia striiformis f. sp. tritici]|uniref:Uncharacterized protein n=1 Tax=Puccinia striiformis f. sp. tritici PST-78 TaxID=1165861 RepID=A0A0L0W1P4_9BASI|nr:hypothetical protein Pst134EA_019659 [Puccinia striiformis f. sp. tritici]KAI9610468.1 hypothetical protein H4Q26_006608 [Puccinia striiformis f. sp. tritici PST-130]KNF05431.1 hypothetical protein PSTG_01645 [Puccinia striiformis f. sp. tritici PST-78]KAH9449756.1 hypothetical protein Pst134EB_020572 [Puccinia striiformis f. sp. tritici]KAH9459509.1 hypothetical protein Pst134EA_019659 [Puccinia striiformis f. sp. tritici]KAI9618704.1 hypothetical protein KEM48_006589 [Puccinia striiformis